MKTMKNYMKNLTAVACLMLLFACNEENNDATFLTVDKSELSFSQKGGEQTLTVESNGSWTVISPKSFITVSPTQGSGTKEVKVTVAEYDDLVAVDESFSLIIRSDDGAKTVNVTIVIKGELVGSKYLMVTNYAEFTIGGQEHLQDILLINTNVEWEVKGPEWIEAWDGARWRPLSMQQGNISGKPDSQDFSVLQVRTASANNETAGRTSTITISEKLTGSVPFTLRVEQVGCEDVRPKALLTLYDSFCTDWVCGNDVQYFYWYASSTNLTNSELQNESTIQKKFTKSYPDYVNSYNWGLQENSTMYLYTRAVTKSGALAANYRHFQYQMPSSKNQPRAPIEKVYKTNKGWYAKIGMNDLALYYIYYVTTNQDIFSWPDVYLAWELDRYTKTNYSEGGDLPYDLMAEPDEETWLVQGDIDIFTWAIGNGARTSGVTDRFISTKDNERRSAAMRAPVILEGCQTGGIPKSELPKLNGLIIRR